MQVSRCVTIGYSDIIKNIQHPTINIPILEVIPAQSAHPYRLIGSLSLPIRLCVRLSPSSPPHSTSPGFWSPERPSNFDFAYAVYIRLCVRLYPSSPLPSLSLPCYSLLPSLPSLPTA